MLSLGNSLSKKTGIVAPGVIKDNLLMEHKYSVESIQPVSDGAVYFDSSNSGVYLSDPFNNQTFTVSAWIYRIDNGASQAIFSAQDSSTDGFMFFTTDDEYVRAKVNSTTTDEVASTLITANTWNHVVAMVTDNSKIEVYVNGVFGDDKALSGSVANTANARIGLNSYDTQNDYKGYICNVGYWNRLLTPAEIKSIMFKQYADLTTTEKTSLVSFWNLDSTVADGIPLVYDENNTTLGPDLWSITDPIGPDTLGGADGDKNASMDLSDVGLAAGDVIKLSGTISGSNGGKILAPDVGAASSGVTRIPSDADYQHTEDGDIEVYMYVSDVTGKLKIRTDHDAGSSEDDRTQKISNIKVQKVTNAGRLI